MMKYMPDNTADECTVKTVTYVTLGLLRIMCSPQSRPNTLWGSGPAGLTGPRLETNGEDPFPPIRGSE